MKFQLPTGLDGLDREALDQALADAQAEYLELTEIADDVITDEQIADLESLAEAIGSIEGQINTQEAEATARAERIAAAKSKVQKPSDEGGDEDPEADPEVDPEADPAEEPAEAPADAAPVPVAAARRPVASRAGKAQKATPEKEAKPLASIKMYAGVDVPDIPSSAPLGSLLEVAGAFKNRVGGFPTHKAKEEVSNRFGVATFRKEVPEANYIRANEQDSNMEKLYALSKQSQRRDAIVAAGGWCAPSETLYGLCSLEEVSGILSIPEVVMDRGGIMFTQGPAFSDIYTDSGFLQTEAQAIAGTTKNFIDVECPAFTEVRMDAIGFGVRAGILTNRTYPELVQRYLEGVIVAHAHKVNSSVISRIVALSGAAIDLAEYGSAYSDSLQGLEMQAVRLRYKYRMAEDALVEGFAPWWYKSVLRADLSYRVSATWESISDAQIDSELRKRGIDLQWVYDWQDLAATGTTWPNTVDIELYPAGAFVKGTLDVIRMDAVYDTAGLAVNTFTAAFFEEGISVFNPCGNGIVARLTLGTTGNQAEILGKVGFPSIGLSQAVFNTDEVA